MAQPCHSSEFSEFPIVKARKSRLEEMRSFNPRDRLEAVNACKTCVDAIHESIAIWKVLLSNPVFMNLLDEKTLNQLLTDLKGLAETHIHLELSTNEALYSTSNEHSSQPYG